jgi:hypothetical protein
MLTTILLIVLITLIIGALPSWQYSRRWGYFPSGVLVLTLAAVVVLAIAGKLT